MPNVLRLRRTPVPPEPNRNSEAVYANAAGELKQVAPDGSETALGGGGGGSQPGVLSSIDFLFTEEADEVGPSYAIAAADPLTNTLTVAGDHVSEFPVNRNFTVSGSTGNDNEGHDYTVTLSSLVGGDTVIQLTIDGGSPADGTADGNINLPGVYSASYPIPAGATVLDVWFVPLAPWAADQALLIAGDGAQGPQAYFASFNLVDLNPYTPYDPTGPDPGTNLGTLATGNGAYGNSSRFRAAPEAYGVGIPYPEGDTATAEIETTVAASPVVPTGQTLIKILYFAAQTPIAATLQ